MLNPADRNEPAVKVAPSQDLVSRREFYTQQLQNLEIPPTEAENTFLRHWSRVLPVEKWGEWALSWARALSAYGTSASFVERVENRLDQFRLLGMDWPCMTREGSNYEMRRALIASQKPYIELTPPELRAPLRIAKSCLLCENILQGLDHRDFPDAVQNNFMLDLGDFVVAPNRYPGLPLHMLWLPKNHDRMETRVAAQSVAVENGKALLLPPESGKTRGNLVCPQELAALFSFCSTMGLVAVRNHPLSGMSLREHDHWHLVPLECYPEGWHSKIAGVSDGSRGETEVMRAAGTPFDILRLRNRSDLALAHEAASVLNELERDDQVFSPTYVPSHGGMLLVAPLRKSAVADRYVQIGGIVQEHGFLPSDAATLAAVERLVPRRYEFNWNGFGVSGDNVKFVETEISREEVLSRYRPMNYSDSVEWGTGKHLEAVCSPLANTVYRELSSFQDKRGDRGHAEVVSFLTARIADMMGLSPSEKEVVIIAAIAHDSGWDVVPNAEAVWNKLAQRVHGADLADRAVAKREMYELRSGHQTKGAERIRSLLPDYPHIDSIAEVVNDHDTRLKVAPPIFRAFLDADWISRVTKVGILSASAGGIDGKNPEAVLERLEGQVKPNDLTLPWAITIARVELASTMIQLKATFGWDAFPASFEERYREEIAALTR